MPTLLLPPALLLLALAGCTSPRAASARAQNVSVTQVTDELVRVHDADHRATCYILTSFGSTLLSCVTHVNVELRPLPQAGAAQPPPQGALQLPPVAPQGPLAPGMRWH